MSKAILAFKIKKKYKFQLLVFRLISPFVLFGIVVYAWINKLRKVYKYKLSPEGMILFANEIEQSVKWSRFSSYEKTENFILLQLDKDEGESDGQVLFPKRCFSENKWLRLIDIFEENDVNSGEIDLNMDI